MDSTGCIEQKGVIEDISDGVASVNITTFSACSHCQSKSACNISENSSRIIEVPVLESTFSVGELVNIIMKRSLGMRAALLAYIFPFMLVLILILTLDSFHVNELITGLMSLLLLVPYFLGLYLYRDRLKKSFTFSLRKAGSDE